MDDELFAKLKQVYIESGKGIKPTMTVEERQEVIRLTFEKHGYTWDDFRDYNADDTYRRFVQGIDNP